jgi:hypothetical protein
MNRATFGWGAALLLLGLLMLADSAGFRLPGGARPLSFFWPILLILLGAWMILGVLRRGSLQNEQAFIDLQGASRAAVRISHGAGELYLKGGAGPGRLAEGTFTGGLEHSSGLSQGTLDVRMSPPTQSFMVFPRFDRHDWDVRLNSEIPMSLYLQMGANKSDIDLRNIKISSLHVETGASQTEVTLPARGRLRADFSMGAASLAILIPEGMAARIRISQGVSSVNVNEARFPRSGDHYQSRDYETAENSAEIKIEAGAAEIKIQ